MDLKNKQKFLQKLQFNKNFLKGIFYSGKKQNLFSFSFWKEFIKKIEGFITNKKLKQIYLFFY